MKNKVDNVFKVLIFVTIAWYVILALSHYFNQRALWNDEECVFQSIHNFSSHELFSKSLAALQVFPRVYLYLIQSFSKNFDFQLLSLRFFPFLFMMLGFFAWLKIASLYFKNKWEYFLFAFSWAGSITLIYYAAELKQYSMDVLAAALLILFIHYQRNFDERPSGMKSYYCLLFLLPFLLLFSYPVLFFLSIPLVNLVVKQNKNKTPLIIYLFSLGICLGISYLFDIRLRPTVTLNKEWGDYFISLSSTGDFFKTFGEGVNNLFSRWFIEKPKILRAIGRIFVMFGLINLIYSFRHIKDWKKGIYSLSSIAVFVFCVMILAGALKKYPFTVPRTSLFFCPIVLFLTIEGFRVLKRFNEKIYKVVTSLYFLFLLVVSLGLAREIFLGDLGAQSVIWSRSIF